MLEINVTLSRGRFTLNAQIKDSGFICLSGLNGSGKSSLLSIIAGKIRPDQGFVRINARDVSKLPMELREVVLVNPDSLIPHLEVDRHLLWGATAKGAHIDLGLVKNLKASLGIAYGGRVDRLSLGMRERVSLATAFLSKPKAILVDEAFSNIDHKDEFVSTFASICREAQIDLMSTTQDAYDARLADHHYELVAGASSRVR